MKEEEKGKGLKRSGEFKEMNVLFLFRSSRLESMVMDFNLQETF